MLSPIIVGFSSALAHLYERMVESAYRKSVSFLLDLCSPFKMFGRQYHGNVLEMAVKPKAGKQKTA